MEKKFLRIVLFLNLSFSFIELFSGIFSKSLALISDSFHMFLDSFAIGLTYFSLIISLKEKNEEKTYGYQRAEIISAFFNSILLLIFSFFIIYKAIFRLYRQEEIKIKLMLYVAIIGFFVNLFSLFLLNRFKNKSLNIKSAYLHVLSDSLNSLLVISSAFLIYFTEKFYFDSIASIIISIFIINSSLKIFIRTLNILMEGVPSNLNIAEIKKEILKIPFVLDIHDLHVWAITTGKPILTAHIVVENNENMQETLYKINKFLKEKYSIGHSTIQLETDYKKDCLQANGNCP